MKIFSFHFPGSPVAPARRRPVRALVTGVALLCCALAPLAAAAEDPRGHWSPRFQPVAPITAPLAILEGELVSGEHRLEDGRWKLFGDGIRPRPETIGAVIADGSDLYVSGWRRVESVFASAFVARWDGNDWTMLPLETFSSYGIPLALFNGQLHAAGEFLIDGQIVSKVVRWDGASWQPVGAPLPHRIHALAAFDGALYAGGGNDDRDDAGPMPGMLARWDGGAWTQTAPSVNAPVESLLAHGDSLYVGGCFTTIGGASAIDALHIARWNGSNWSALGTGVGSDAECGAGGRSGTSRDTVLAIVAYDDDLVVAGSFDNIGDVETRNIARWDGSTWTRFGEGFNRPVGSLVAHDGDLFAIGRYADVVSGAAIPGVARWNGDSWGAVAEAGPTVGLVNVLESDDDDLYAGGYFDTAGGSEIHAIARWNGVSWSAVGDSLDGAAFDLAVIGKTVYVAGSLRTSPGEPFEYQVARWNGSSWQRIDDGLAVYLEIEAFDGELYAAGDRNQNGALLARWDGNDWSTLAELERGYIGQLEAGDKLYVTGNLTSLGDGEYDKIAAWDGNDWIAFPSLNGWIHRLTWSGSDLFASGYFGENENYERVAVARWNGLKWRPIGRTDSLGQVNTASAKGDDLFVNAYRLLIDGKPYDGLAHWNGESWQAAGRIQPWTMAFVGDKAYFAGVSTEDGATRETIGLYALGTCGNGVLDAGEQCDAGIAGTGACCNTNTCRLAGGGSVCRPSRGPCDVAETCSGNTSACPIDKLRPDGFVCREASDECASTGVCDGEGLTCSVDAIPPCGDGNFCNGVETCLPDGACQSGADIECDDGDVCTTDFCLEGAEQCGGGLAPGPGCTRCGDINFDGWISTSDALAALRGAVGLEACPAFPCDHDGNGTVTTADALRILRRAVGWSVPSNCPGDTGEWPEDDPEDEEEQPDG